MLSYSYIQFGTIIMSVFALGVAFGAVGMLCVIVQMWRKKYRHG